MNNLNKDIKILVADDMAGMRRFVGTKLNELGFKNVVYASDGQEGFDLVSDPANGIDLILSDINMPVMNGIEFLKKVKSNNNLKSLKFIMITAEVDMKTMSETIQSGVDEYIVKPFEAEQLLDKISRVFKTKKSQQSLDINGVIEHFNRFIVESLTEQCHVTVTSVEEVENFKTDKLKGLQSTSCFYSAADCKNSIGNLGIMIHFGESDYLKFIGSMFGSEFVELEDDFNDIVSEILNIALGKAKGHFNDELKQDFNMDIPTTISGEDLCLDVSKSDKFKAFRLNTSVGIGHIFYQIGGNKRIPWKLI